MNLFRNAILISVIIFFITNANPNRTYQTKFINLKNSLHEMEIKTPYNTGLAKVAVQCSADTFVVNQSLVLRINICGLNRHLRQARKR